MFILELLNIIRKEYNGLVEVECDGGYREPTKNFEISFVDIHGGYNDFVRLRFEDRE